MDSMPQRGAEGPRRGAARVEPDNPDGDVEQWLRDPELESASERLRRLGGDEDLLLALQLANFSPRGWDPVAQEFARYGLAVFQSWIGRGTVFQHVAARTRYGLPPPHDNWLSDPTTATELAGDTVIDGLDHFLHDVLEKGVWTPTKRASLKTFFIGQCLFQFANRYRAMWTRERDYRRHHTLAVPVDLEIFSHSTGGADDTTVLKAELADALDRVGPEQVRRAFLLREAGYTHAEIAGRLGLANAKAVENLLGYRTIRKTQERRQRRTS